MMNEHDAARWRLPGDDTPPVITAQKHIKSKHRGGDAPALPKTCVLFELGGALPLIEAEHPARVLRERLPCFIADSRCVLIDGLDGVCFVKGGYGAPAAVDVLETLRALGVGRVLVAGMCGGYARDVRVGDLLIPAQVRCEEGTSLHYYERIECATPDAALLARATAFFSGLYRVANTPTVTSDAFYRQTFAKEAFWRALGCAGVDMEASALLSVSRYYHMPAVALLLCSDRHPTSEAEPGWDWGDPAFPETKKQFVRNVVAFAREIAQEP